MLYRHREYPENASTAVWQFQEDDYKAFYISGR